MKNLISGSLWVKDKLSNDRFYLLLIFLLASCLFLVIKLSHLVWRISDEATYLYSAQLTNQGFIPYRDFFLAHPPLHNYFLASILNFFGVNLYLLHSVLFILTIITAWNILLIANHYSSSKFAIFSPLIFFFSFNTLATTEAYTGVHLTVFFLVLSLLFLIRQRPILSGLLSGLALITRLYAIPVVAAYTAATIIKSIKSQSKWKLLIQYLLATVLIPITTAVVFWLIADSNFFNQTIWYHLKKTASISKQNIILAFITYDWFLILTLPMLLPLIRKRKYLFITIPVVSLLFFYLIYADIALLYFLLIIPFLSLIFSLWLEKSHLLYSWGGKMAVLILFTLYIISTITRYSLEKAPLGIMPQIEDIASYIKNHSQPNETIYGASEITPLIALLADRPITGNFVDTNEKIFSTKIVDKDKRLEEVKKLKVRFFITPVLWTDKGRILDLDRWGSGKFFHENCSIARTYNLPYNARHNTLIIWDCQED